MLQSNCLWKTLLAISLTVWFSSCTAKRWSSENALRPTVAPQIIDSSEAASLNTALEQSLAYLNVLPAARSFAFGKRTVSRDQMIETLTDFRTALITFGLTEQFYRYVQQNFDFYELDAGSPLVTGYYEGTLNGSKNRSEKFAYPIYRLPDNLVKVELQKFPALAAIENLPPVIRGMISPTNSIVPYYTRDEIDFKSVLSDKKLEIAWVDDPIKLFFLHVQGSGVINLDDGTTLRVNFAEANGQPYRSIGKYLIDQGVLTAANTSMHTIVDYLRTNPERTREVFAYNPSYIFFRVVSEGPIGSLGRVITPYRSIASDPSLYPRAALAFLKIQLPQQHTGLEQPETKPFAGFVLNQDTGGAIKGPLRIDLFTGRGEESESIAGNLKAEGVLYFLVKKSIAN